MITIEEYTKLFVTIIVGLGLIFEMPVLVFFLALMQVITARWMLRNLRYSMLAIFVVAAIITPTADILNMCLFAAPMIALTPSVLEWLGWSIPRGFQKYKLANLYS